MAGAAGTEAFGQEVRCEMRWAQNHARTTEFLVCLMMRWYNMHSHYSILYALTCLLLATGAGGKAAQPRSSEKNAASRAGQTPCARWAVRICYTRALKSA